jgi:adenylate kinase
VEINIPELNPEMVRAFFLNSPSIFLFLTISYDAQDVYRIGTLMELVRVLALSFADDGKNVKVLFSCLRLI